jgi:hypothetical protein
MQTAFWATFPELQSAGDAGTSSSPPHDAAAASLPAGASELGGSMPPGRDVDTPPPAEAGATSTAGHKRKFDALPPATPAIGASTAATGEAPAAAAQPVAARAQVPAKRARTDDVAGDQAGRAAEAGDRENDDVAARLTPSSSEPTVQWTTEAVTEQLGVEPTTLRADDVHRSREDGRDFRFVRRHDGLRHPTWEFQPLT